LLSDHLVYAHHKTLTGYPHLPTLDRIGAGGIQFDNALAVCPLCQPARASMLTGVYPHRHGMLLNDGDAGSRVDFEPDERLISHYLKQAGYRVGYFGKWHCGEVRTAQDYGFEGLSMSGYGHPYWTDAYADYLERLGLPQAEVTIEWKFGEPSWRGKTVVLEDFPHPYKSPYYLMESCGRLNTPVETHEAYFLAHLATHWLEEVATDRPFFLRFDPWGPHHPYFVGDPFLNTIDPSALPEYPSFRSSLDHRPHNHRDLLDYRRREGSSPNWSDWQPILARCHEHAAQVDNAVGRVVDALERLDLLENTLLIYTADHGGAVGSNGGLFDKGWLMVEETLQIPLAIRWPGRAKSRARSDKFVTNMDLVPTVLEAAGAEIPSPLDGRSLLGLIQDPEGVTWPEDVMLQHHGHYKERHFQRLLRFGPFKYVAHLDDSDELYDLEKDPFEQENLVDAQEMRPVLNEMRQRLIHQMVTHDDEARQATALIGQMGA
jgi:arylsulfatase A-like enzyme